MAGSQIKVNFCHLILSPQNPKTPLERDLLIRQDYYYSDCFLARAWLWAVSDLII